MSKRKAPAEPKADSSPDDWDQNKEESWGHRALILLRDLISLHDVLWEETAESEAAGIRKSELAPHLFRVLDKGHDYGLLDAPTKPPSFLRGQEDFLKGKMESNGVYTHSLDFVSSLVSEFSQAPDEPSKEGSKAAAKKSSDKDEPVIPGSGDVRLLRSGQDNPKISQADQAGNDRMLGLVDQYVRTNSEKHRLSTLSSRKRAVAALAIHDLTLESEVGSKRKEIDKPSRAKFVVAPQNDSETRWQPVSRTDAVEVTLILLFEKFLERDQAPWGILKKSAGATEEASQQDFSNPGTEPIRTPESHDVLFGRGGLTNNHPGNRRYRDIISLHRPDYVSAVKTEKPNVARRIVRAIRTGAPPGRFLKKKSEDNMWYDVGDRHAAEKTSQALREKLKYKNKANPEKASKSESPKKSGAASISADLPETHAKESGHQPFAASAAAAQIGPYSMALRAIPVTSKKEEGKDQAKEAMYRRPSKNDENDAGENGGGKEADDENSGKNFPPPVDEKGNIVVTDHDILCGRGGLTNQHKGNKRFRDIVSLHRADYIRAPKVLKPNVARLIVGAIRQGDPPGRFLKKDIKAGVWYDIGDRKAAEKASQALREKASVGETSGGEKDGSPQKASASNAKKSEASIVPREASTSDKPTNEGKPEAGKEKTEKKVAAEHTVSV